MPCKTRADLQLFVVFIAADTGQIIAMLVKQQRYNVLDCGFDGRRLAGTKLAVYFKKRLIAVFGCIFVADGLYFGRNMENALPFPGTEATLI